jgi:hypothetical protein
MNAAFEVPQAEVSARRNQNVGVGSRRAVAIAEKLLEAEGQKDARRCFGEGQAHEGTRVR